ncbi:MULTISPECIES: hypothetical protein [Pseudoalteromonas]|uniref:hypothetical protein n=1 Tax=Pseudoalteromonas TaxID=53246 RepID=UPI0019D15CF2|nr:MULTISPECIES: hypothetical protein [Pseudoalteromonas]MBR8843874.1 hypothetical protein [Pseudoalteromonas sp. JC3]UDM60733.1 hypothetical protein KIJ96_13020 [Pseudoalteromonas piscicida]WJE08127.1 hypothetical protein QSH61_14715 [Pseudoalteromonas sp. JC3]
MEHAAAVALCESVQYSFASGLSASEVARLYGLERSVCIKLREMNMSWQSRFCNELTRMKAIAVITNFDKAIQLAQYIPSLNAAQQRKLKYAYSQFLQDKENSLEVNLIDAFMGNLSANLFSSASLYGSRSKHSLPSKLVKAMCDFPASLMTIYRSSLILEQIVKLNIDHALVAKSAAFTSLAFSRESMVIDLIHKGANLAFIRRFLPDFHITPQAYRVWRDTYCVSTEPECVASGSRLVLVEQYERLIHEQRYTTVDVYLMLNESTGFRIETIFTTLQMAFEDENLYHNSNSYKELELVGS